MEIRPDAGGEEDNDWSGWNEDEDQGRASCLFCSFQGPSAGSVLDHCKEVHSFDIKQCQQTHGLDFYGSIRLVNYIRAGVKAGVAQADILSGLASSEDWKLDDRYLKPVIADDVLLFELEDSDDDEDSDDEDSNELARRLAANANLGDKTETTGASSSSSAQPSIDTANVQELQTLNARLMKDNAVLFHKMAALESTVNTMRETMMKLNFGEDDKASSSSPSTGAEKTTGANTEKVEEKKELMINHDEGYFESYSTRGIHEVMLKDKVRTCAYRDFMYNNKHLFEGKVVLDIGCGTGILSMFAATAGARKVISIDMADIIDKAKLIATENKFEHVITFIKSKVEEVKMTEKVDLIISEWMGYFLLYESMLPSVLHARDNWLVEGGGVYPNRATMFIAGAERSAYNEDKLEYWKDVYGFNMSCLIMDQDKYTGTEVTTIKEEAIITDSQQILDIDILTCKVRDLEFCSKVSLTVKKEQSLDLFVVWFDTDFNFNCTTPVTLSTSAFSTPTHWYQTVFHLGKPVQVKEGDVVEVEITADRGKKNNRDYETTLRYRIASSDNSADWIVQEFTV